jgi:hypothetical protein
MSLFPIFKVNKLSDKNVTETIYVFFGSQFSEEIDDPSELFIKEPGNKAFGSVFDENELKDIKKNNIEVLFINQSIHIDDSIGVIKLKIFEAISKQASMSELYLFCLKSEKLNPITVYQNLTQNDRLPLTKIRLNQLLLNIYNEEGKIIDFNIPDKEQYTFDDILKLDLLEREYLVGKPLGQKLVFSNEYPFIADPFLVNEYDNLLENSRRELSTLSSNLLLETGPIFRNSIYLCLAKDVFLNNENDISTEYTSKIYFPFLYQDKIDTIEKLEANQNKLIENTSEKLNSDTKKNFQNIDMFYDVFKYQKPSNQFSENNRLTGIKNLKVIIYPEFKIKIPIEVIFKLIHATEEFPLIKYNPENRQENIYRLFAPEITVDGRKIPILQKSTIFKLMKSIGKNKSVAVYTNINYKGFDLLMACEFEENGNIIVYPLTDFDSPILMTNGENMFENIDNIVSLTVNPLIEQIKSFFEQSGLLIPLFNSIQSPNVEVRDLLFQICYNITKPIDIKKYIGCISSVFIVESSDFSKNGIEMRFKRVSNFNKRDSQEAFIIEKIDQGLKIDEIIDELLKQFDDLDEEIATDLIIKIRSELDVIRGANKRRALMIKINPGFKTIMNINLITSELTIFVSGINDIYYLNTIPVYLNTIVRITQDIDSTNIESSLIKNLCSGKEIEDIEFGQITAQSERSLEENEIPIIEDESIKYSDSDEKSDKRGEYMDDLLDILGFEENESPELTGGQTLSSESVKSDVLSDSLSSKNILAKKEVVSSPELEESDLDLSELGFNSKSSSESVSKEEEVPIVLEEETKEAGPIVLEEETKEKEVPIEKTKEEEVPIEKTKEKEVPIEETKEEEPIFLEEETKEEKESIVLEEVEKIPLEIKSKKQNTLKETETKNTVRDITGMNLKYPNPFSLRIEERMPQLFVKSKDEKFDVYTRMCPFSLSNRRQPVILTKEEKDKIIENHHGEINEDADFIEYGTDAKDSSKKYYYTCPRYWCLLTDTMVTEKDILDGKCGPKVKKIEDAIIGKKDEVVPKGKYVYKFYDEDVKKYPGFHKQKTPSGLCIPCCFSNWSTTEMKNRRDICQGKFDESKAEPISEKEKSLEEELRRDIIEVEHYVKGPEKYGKYLGEHRWGFLPISVQKFLHEISEDCQISKTNMNLKLNHTCILRHGVEISSNQSFIACIASAIFYGQRDEQTKKPLITKYMPNAKHEVPSIKEMKKLIIDAIDIDKFIKYQNGDLITSFANQELKVNIEDYKNSKLYKKMLSNKKENEIKVFIERVAQAFETFKKFLEDDKINIDYTYLWDLISMPNPNLFEVGVNLIILEIPEDDATNNINLVCPTNHYSVNVYDARKRSLILIKRENYFEPIYGYRNDGNKIYITKTFSEFDRKLPKTLRAVFSKIIKPTIGEKCRAFLSKPNEYRFKEAPILDKLIKELINKKYKIITQVLNFQGKVIGVMVKNKEGLEGFIPCFPSSLTILKNSKLCNKINNEEIQIEKKCDYDFVYMNDSIWKPYDETLEFLKEYYDYQEPKDILKANCYDPKYFCRIVEDELITGFLTNTNQFIPIKDPIPVSNVDDGIKTITNNDMLVADINTLTKNNVDTKRVDFIKRIQLETNYYNVFRNTIRILFNDYINSEKRKAIQDECNKRYVLYRNQLDKVIELLHDLVKDSIIFASPEESYKLMDKDINVSDITTCVSLNKEKCLEKKGSVCKITNNKCTLVLSKENLVNGSDNELFYYGRMADELIRYNRIKSFIFKPQAYLSFGQVKYNLRDNEIIVLQDLLNQEFFENLIPAEINNYAKYNTYDTAEPIKTQLYKSDFELDEIINPNYVRDCIKTKPQKITSGYWRDCFPENYKEIEYKNSINCPLYLIIDLVNEIKKKSLTIEEIKDDLIDEYVKLTNNFSNRERVNKIIEILKEEGQIDASQLQDNSMNFEQLIIQDGFLATNFDLWILLVRYEIPSIFISSKTISESRYKFKEFVCYDPSKENKYVFIWTPAMYRRTNKIPEYKIIINEKEKIEIDIDVLKEGECLTNIENALNNYISIEDYVDVIFEKYNPKQNELEETNKIVRKSKKLKPTLIIKEEEEVFEDEIIPIVEKEVIEEKDEIMLPEEEKIEIIPVRKRKTRKQREQKVKVNLPGKKVTRRKLPENVEILNVVEEIN